MFLDKVQLVKMECDIVAFFFTSKKLEKEIIEIHLPALKEKDFMRNTVECGELISYSTAMQVNFGLALELTLKRIGYMCGHKQKITGHKLAKIYDLLSCDIKNELEADFKNWQTDNDFKPWEINLKHTSDTKEMSIKTFLELLRFLDNHDLYGKRYDFESFSIEKDQKIITPSFFETFFNRLNNKQWG